MTIEEELKYYETALDHYIDKKYIREDRDKPWELQRLDRGFCWYFSTLYFPNLSILFKLKPESTNSVNTTNYWFLPGKLEPRIVLLEKAIKICKEKLKENDKRKDSYTIPC